MSHKKKRPKARPTIHPPRPNREVSKDHVLNDTTAAFTSSHAVVKDFLLYCDEEIERMEMNTDFGHVAQEIWAGRSGRGATIVAALADYIAICQQHRDAILALRPRFATLVADNVHERAEPIALWRELIRTRLLAPPEPSNVPDPGSSGHP
jgi:hypothetical protein